MPVTMYFFSTLFLTFMHDHNCKYFIVQIVSLQFVALQVVDTVNILNCNGVRARLSSYFVEGRLVLLLGYIF